MRYVVSALLIATVASRVHAQAALSGYVRDSASLRGLNGVEVSFDGSDKRSRSNKDGKYEVRDVRAGTALVHLRVVGYAPVDTAMDFADGEKKEIVFFLHKPPVVLDSMVSTSRRGSVTDAGWSGFDQRRRLGLGKFLGPEELRDNQQRRLSDILRDMAGVRVETPSTCEPERRMLCDWRVAIGRSNAGGLCALEVRMDGNIINKAVLINDRITQKGAYLDPDREKQWGAAFDLNSISLASLAGVEVYRSPSETPLVYSGANGVTCGTLLLWTKR